MSRTVPVRHVTYRYCQARHVPFLPGMSRILPVRHVTYHCCQACSGVCSHTPAAYSLSNRPGGSCLWSSLCSRQTTGCRSPRRVGGGFLSAMDREKYSKRNSVCIGAETLSRRYSVYNRTGTLRQEAFIQSGKGREDWENGSVVSGKGREDWENGSVISGMGREDWENGSVISLEWAGKTGITEV